MTILGGASVAADLSDGVSSAEDLILRARASTDTRNKLVALEWARSLFGWSTLSLDTMIMLAGRIQSSSILNNFFALIRSYERFHSMSIYVTMLCFYRRKIRTDSRCDIEVVFAVARRNFRSR